MTNRTADDLIIETSDTLDGQTFNIKVYKNKVIVTRYGGKTRRYTNDLETASLREENEKLKSEAKEQYSAGLMCERILAKDQIKQLQEEVERLKGLLKNVLPMAEDGYTLHKKNGSHQEFLSEDRELLQSIREALSSKESKPS